MEGGEAHMAGFLNGEALRPNRSCSTERLHNGVPRVHVPSVPSLDGTILIFCLVEGMRERWDGRCLSSSSTTVDCAICIHAWNNRIKHSGNSRTATTAGAPNPLAHRRRRGWIGRSPAPDPPPPLSLPPSFAAAESPSSGSAAAALPTSKLRRHSSPPHRHHRSRSRRASR
uniref:Uncharacterized protein n=1 Tax=Oryza sativa subsp. japonica TaxID=39947 RepID=Q6YUI9_ORYSJ|nr:hypothetical protein [Oryza sativa Japonica Group]